MRFGVFSIVLILASSLFAGVAVAQDEVSFQVTRDGAPAADVDISMIVNGIKTPVGQTDSDGNAKISMNLINVIKGTAVEVNVIRSADATQIVMVAAGESDDDCNDAEADPDDDDDCDRLGTFIWTSGATVMIDVTSTGSTMSVEPAGANFPIQLGLGLQFSNFPNLVDVACDQVGITSQCRGDDGSVGPGGFIEVGIGTTQFFVGFGGLRGSMDVVQSFTPGQGNPTSAIAEVDWYTIGVYAGRRFPVTPSTGLSAFFGGSSAHNDGHFMYEFGDVTRSAERSQTTRQLHSGLALNIELGGGFGLRFGGDIRTSFKGDKDADQSIGGAIMATWSTGKTLIGISPMPEPEWDVFPP